VVKADGARGRGNGVGPAPGVVRAYRLSRERYPSSLIEFIVAGGPGGGLDSPPNSGRRRPTGRDCGPTFLDCQP
jgi:hypothetical protein